MIVEDYCSFEIAKLLKEKGFDAEIKTYWSFGLLNEPILEFVEDPYAFDVSNSDGFVGFNGVKYSSANIVCIAPTLQMATKWLREVHNLHIVVFYYDNSAFPYIWYIFAHNGDKPHKANSYEQACEAAIKYCLENLV